MSRECWAPKASGSGRNGCGAILATDRGAQRLPLWMLDAVALVEGFHRSVDDAAHWEALARFRKVLEPGVEMAAGSAAALVSMTDFLSGLEVSLTDSFSISSNPAGDNFEILPFDSARPASGGMPTEAMAELAGEDLRTFQHRLRERGALNAFRLGRGRFLVVDRAAAPALKVMVEAQRDPLEERRAFIRNPRARITEAVEVQLRRQPDFVNLPPDAQEEAVEAIAGHLLVETEEYIRFSDWVAGLEIYQGNPLAEFTSSGTTWLPKVFARAVIERLDAMDAPGLVALRDHVQAAMEAGQESVAFEGHDLLATAQTLQVIEAKLEERHASEVALEDPPPEEPSASGPVILTTADNFTEVQWRSDRGPRRSAQPVTVPGHPFCLGPSCARGADGE